MEDLLERKREKGREVLVMCYLSCSCMAISGRNSLSAPHCDQTSEMINSKRENSYLAHWFRAFSPWWFGPIILETVAGDCVRDPVVSKAALHRLKMKGSTDGIKSQYPLQKHPQMISLHSTTPHYKSFSTTHYHHILLTKPLAYWVTFEVKTIIISSIHRTGQEPLWNRLFQWLQETNPLSQ